MKVKELIEYLSKQDPEMDVMQFVEGGDDYLSCYADIEPEVKQVMLNDKDWVDIDSDYLNPKYTAETWPHSPSSYHYYAVKCGKVQANLKKTIVTF